MDAVNTAKEENILSVFTDGNGKDVILYKGVLPSPDNEQKWLYEAKQKLGQVKEQGLI